jgi:hypothetical protein
MNARELENRLENYLAVRSALGYRDYFLRSLLQDFVRYVVARHQDGPIRAGTAVDWACSTSGHNGASRLAYRLSAARFPHTLACKHTGHGSSGSRPTKEVTQADTVPFFEQPNPRSSQGSLDNRPRGFPAPAYLRNDPGTDGEYRNPSKGGNPAHHWRR